MIDERTKFVSCGDTLRQKTFKEDPVYNNFNVKPVYIGVNEFEGQILVGGYRLELIDEYENEYHSMGWGGGVLLPADLFYLNIRDMREKGSSLYIPRKDRFSLFSEDIQSYQKNDNTNNYLLSGQNAIGRTGMSRSYSVYDSDRISKTTEFETTSDYVSGADYETVDFSAWNDPSIYLSDSQGRFENSDSDIIEIGYATYNVLMNEGEEDEYIARPQKYIDITFDEDTSKWSWGSYSTFTEPVDSDFNMSDGEDSISLEFYQYSFKFQTVMCFDEGGVK